VSYPFVSAAELALELESQNPPAVLDASYILHTPEFDGDYRRETGRPIWSAGHIPGSIYVDVPSDFSDQSSALHYTHPEPQAIADELARMGIREGQRVVVYDSTATIWAARLWYLVTLDGGLGAWIAAGYPIETGEAQTPSPALTWAATTPRDAWIDRAELEARSDDDGRSLVCGLPPGSFTGSAPTRYSRRGRIPGSVNVSSRALFSPDGTVLAADEVAAAYRAAGVSLDSDAPEILLYCGGGISASANALTLAALGVRSVRIYDGSLEEWSADPDLPLDLD
jgi:thiosulfate/3-mercaptopyruvate sulfurtransferase